MMVVAVVKLRMLVSKSGEMSYVGSDGQLWSAGANHAGQVSANLTVESLRVVHVSTSLQRSAVIQLARKSRHSNGLTVLY